MAIEYVLDKNLMYVIQNATNLTTHEILDYIVNVSGRVIETMSSKEYNNKDYKNVWPDTQIPIRVSIHKWSENVTVKFAMPQKLAKLNQREVQQILTDATLLDGGTPSILKPKTKTPRGMRGV